MTLTCMMSTGVTEKSSLQGWRDQSQSRGLCVVGPQSEKTIKILRSFSTEKNILFHQRQVNNLEIFQCLTLPGWLKAKY